MQVLKLEAPLPDDLATELIAFWRLVAPDSDAIYGPILRGAESTHNRDIVYLARDGERLAATVHLTHALALPRLGGLGEVVTAPPYRQQGLSQMLCTLARDDFRAADGEALFLGTVNPSAARIYRRLGWRRLAGSNVMLNMVDGSLPEAFLVHYFTSPGEVVINPLTTTDRIALIPLLLTPHDWQILDANVGMYSIRYATQNACMSLYPKYQAQTHDGQGACFSMRGQDGRLFGLATVRLVDAARAVVDGFVHASIQEYWDDLIQAAVNWAIERRVTSLSVLLSAEDKDKQSRFEALGFHRCAEAKAPFSLDGRPVPAIEWVKSLA